MNKDIDMLSTIKGSIQNSKGNIHHEECNKKHDDEKNNTSESTINFVNKDSSLKILLNDQDLHKTINHNPWIVNIKKVLNDISSHMYENAYIKFKIGGKIVYSASQLVRSKSFFIIQDSQNAHNELEVNEVDSDNLGKDEQGEIASDITIDENSFLKNLDMNSQTENQLAQLGGVNNYNNPMLNEIDDQNGQFTSEEINNLVGIDPKANSFYRVDREGNHILQTPMRQSFRRITFNDLGKALVRTLNYQIIERKKRKKNHEFFDDDANPVLLPESLIKNAEEERALVELQINRIYDHIIELYINKEPISFLKVIIAPNPEGIVNTILYLLQLVNRKKIDLWQKIEDDSEESENSTKRSKRKRNEEIQLSKPKIHKEIDSGAFDIFLTPKM